VNDMKWLDDIENKLTGIAEHYGKSAPTVTSWAEDLYLRIKKDTTKVVLAELLFLNRFVEEGIWWHPNDAANQVYHLMHRLGQDTTGHAGF